MGLYAANCRLYVYFQKFSFVVHQFTSCSEISEAQSEISRISLRPAFAPMLKQAVDALVNIPSMLQNGFRKCGLVPFDPDAVIYRMLFHTNDEIQRASVALDVVESYLTPLQHKTFNDNEKAVSWTGSTCDINLFQMWKQIKAVSTETPTDSTLVDPAEAEAFLGFDETETTADSSRTSMLTRLIQEQSEETLSQPDTESSTSAPQSVLLDIGNLTESSTGKQHGIMVEIPTDFFNQAFRIPAETQTKSGRTRKTLRKPPPVVGH